jgi:hypothetical protein
LLLSHPRWHPSILEQLQLLSTPRPDLPLDPGFCFWLSVFQARFVLNHLAWFQPHRLRGPVPTHTIDRFISLPPSLFAYGHASLFFASVYLSLRSAASPDSRLLIAIQSSLLLPPIASGRLLSSAHDTGIFSDLAAFDSDFLIPISHRCQSSLASGQTLLFLPSNRHIRLPRGRCCPLCSLLHHLTEVGNSPLATLCCLSRPSSPWIPPRPSPSENRNEIWGTRSLISRSIY